MQQREREERGERDKRDKRGTAQREGEQKLGDGETDQGALGSAGVALVVVVVVTAAAVEASGGQIIGGAPLLKAD
jgi:hypothetical protein